GNSIVETAEEIGATAQIGFTQHRDRDAAESLLAAFGRLYEWGVNPDWAAVQAGPCPPVDLPVYPWDHKPFWLPERRAGSARSTGAVAFPGRPVRSPLLDQPVFEIEAGEPSLEAFRDHRVGGESRLPATALLELMRSAAAAAGNTGAVVTDAGVVRAV